MRNLYRACWYRRFLRCGNSEIRRLPDTPAQFSSLDFSGIAYWSPYNADYRRFLELLHPEDCRDSVVLCRLADVLTKYLWENSLLVLSGQTQGRYLSVMQWQVFLNTLVKTATFSMIFLCHIHMIKPIELLALLIQIKPVQTV